MSGKNGRGTDDRRLGKRHGNGIREYGGRFFVVPAGPNGNTSPEQERKIIGLHHGDGPIAWTVEEARHYHKISEPGYIGRYII